MNIFRRYSVLVLAYRNKDNRSFRISGAEDFHMCSQIVSPLNVCALETGSWVLPASLKRHDTFKPFNFTRFGQRIARNLNDKAYLLVLLAGQEFEAGREEQARSLLDAAYVAYDCDIRRR